jgi:hypothetical protein
MRGKEKKHKARKGEPNEGGDVWGFVDFDTGGMLQFSS